MSTCDHKPKVSTLKSYSDLLQRKSFQLNYFKDYQHLETSKARTFSPLQPWEAESVKNNAIKSSFEAASTRILPKFKRSPNKYSEKLITISLAEAKNENKEKKIDFVHHTNTADYIREYRMTRHHLSDAERKRGSQQVLKAYLNFSKSNRSVKYDNLPRVNIQCGSTKEEDGASHYEGIAAVVNKSRSFDSLPPRGARIRLPELKSSGKILKNYPRFLDLVTLEERRPTLVKKVNDEPTIQYRFSSMDKEKLMMKSTLRNSSTSTSDFSGLERKKTQKFLPKIDYPLMATAESFKKASATKTNMFRRSSSPEKERKKLTPLPEEDISKKNGIIHDNSSTAAVKTSQNYAFFGPPKTSVSSYLTNGSCLRSQSIREILLATVTELQPFPEQDSPPEQNDNSPQPESKSPESKPPVEIKKESISYQIFRSLSHKPSMKKLIEKFYTPVKEKSLGKSNSCLIAGKLLGKSSSQSTSCPHFHLSKKLNKRKLNFAKYREQRLQAKEKRENLKQQKLLEPLTNVLDLTILPKHETGVKSSASQHNKAV